MSGILNIVSVRVKNLHINPANPQDNTAFSSINKAKAHSRKLGGAGKVRALSKDQAFDFCREYRVADLEVQFKAAQAASDTSSKALDKAVNDLHNNHQQVLFDELQEKVEAAKKNYDAAVDVLGYLQEELRVAKGSVK